MHKLVILIEDLDEWDSFDENWPQFLHLVESMPELRRETTSRMEQHLFGSQAFGMIHELYFESAAAARQALASPAGSAAGQLLQRLTRGRIVLLFADHQEEEMENLRKPA